MFANPRGYHFPSGTTEVLEAKKIPLVVEEGDVPMELA